MFPMRTILHPTDFSDCARCAFRVASVLARNPGANLVILHVKSTLGPMVAYGAALVRREPAEYQERLWKALRRFEAPGMRIEYRLVEGEPAPEILHLADRIGCDLVVMGTHGRTGLRRLLMGSVAEQVVRKTHCAVVTVRATPSAGSDLVDPQQARGAPALCSTSPNAICL